MTSFVIVALLAVVMLQMWDKHRRFTAANVRPLSPPVFDPMIDRYSTRGTIRVYDGKRPACHHLPTDEEPLVELSWHTDKPATRGVLYMDVDKGTILRSGTARWYRVFTSEDVAIIDGHITDKYGIGHMTLNTVELKQGGPFVIHTMTITDSGLGARNNLRDTCISGERKAMSEFIHPEAALVARASLYNVPWEMVQKWREELMCEVCGAKNQQRHACARLRRLLKHPFILLVTCLSRCDPMARLHAALTVIWLLLAVPAILWWKNSVPFLVFISVYAVVVGHWDAYQTAKAEERGNE